MHEPHRPAAGHLRRTSPKAGRRKESIMSNTTLTRLAALTRPGTKVAAKAALKAAGLKQTLADDLISEAATLKKLRAAKAAARAERRNGTGRRPVRLPHGTPLERLTAQRIAAVRAAYAHSYRKATHGQIVVHLTTDPADVGSRQDERQEWGAYGRACKYPMRVQDTHLTVPADWRVRIARRGLAVVDGMMTLDAAPLDGAPAGIELYIATWLVQGRGTSTVVQRGAIARDAAGHSYHGADPQRALAGLQRKIKGAQWEAVVRHADLAVLVAQVPDTLVRISDARAIGACEYGIKSWCNRTGLPYESGQATLAEIWAAYQAIPVPEARAAMLHALRRARRHLFAA